jgi:hypothetical protein
MPRSAKKSRRNEARDESWGSQVHGGFRGDDAYSGACKCSAGTLAVAITAISGRPAVNFGPYTTICQSTAIEVERNRDDIHEVRSNQEVMFIPVGPAGRPGAAIHRSYVTHADERGRFYFDLMLLAVYGLRAGEVAGLHLEDFDWQLERLHSASDTSRTVVGSAASAGRSARRRSWPTSRPLR